LEEVGTVDVLVNNAGIGINFISDISESDDEKALAEYQVNVLGTLRVTKFVIPGMLKNEKGSIVNIASFKGLYNMSTMSSLTYGPSKAAVIALTKALAKTYSPKGVRFNAVMPGYIRTDVAEDWPKGNMGSHQQWNFTRENWRTTRSCRTRYVSSIRQGILHHRI